MVTGVPLLVGAPGLALPIESATALEIEPPARASCSIALDTYVSPYTQPTARDLEAAVRRLARDADRE